MFETLFQDKLAGMDATQRRVFLATTPYEAMLSMLVDKSKNADARCELRPSTIHGLGLFAVQDIDKDEVITHYPAHGFVLSRTGKALSDERERIVLPAEIANDLSSYARTRLRFPTEYERSTYNFRVNPAFDIIGYPDMVDSHLLLAHMANDAICTTDTEYNRAGEIRYTHAALVTNNAHLDQIQLGIIGLVAKRPIRIGEEITVSYGYDYWVSNNKLTGTRA